MLKRGCAFIFANGLVARVDLLKEQILQADYLVAADGGLRFLRALALLPHLLIGDLDSLTAEEVQAARAAGVEVRQFPVQKDETDLELAVTAVVQAGYQQIRIVGALGGRLDMTLGNLFLLLLPELQGLDARLEDGQEEVYLIRAEEGERIISGQVGERVSLLPLGAPTEGIVTHGLYYPLRHETLLPERTRGISNVLTTPNATIRLERGILVCIHSYHRIEEEK